MGTDPFTGQKAMHRGIDIGRNLSPPQAIEGAGIAAIAGGRVTASFHSASAGNMITLDHGGGVFSTYMHNEINLVRVGQPVSQGQAIGRVGNTGRSTPGKSSTKKSRKKIQKSYCK